MWAFSLSGVEIFSLQKKWKSWGRVRLVWRVARKRHMINCGG